MLVVFREVLYTGTVLTSKIITRALMRGMIEPTVVYGTESLRYGTLSEERESTPWFDHDQKLCRCFVNLVTKLPFYFKQEEEINTVIEDVTSLMKLLVISNKYLELSSLFADCASNTQWTVTPSPCTSSFPCLYKSTAT